MALLKSRGLCKHYEGDRTRYTDLLQKKEEKPVVVKEGAGPLASSLGGLSDRGKLSLHLMLKTMTFVKKTVAKRGEDKKTISFE